VVSGWTWVAIEHRMPWPAWLMGSVAGCTTLEPLRLWLYGASVSAPHHDLRTT
jgi:hypothetical protein